jgi:hypothetical protein
VRKPNSFLVIGKREEFATPGRCLARSAVEDALDPEGGPPEPEILTDSILKQVRKNVETDAKWFACFCISVKEDDGMSWSAESVTTALAGTYPRYKRWCFGDKTSTDSLPLIAMYLGKKRFLKLAADHGLTTSFLTLRSWMTPVIIGAALLVGVLENVLKAVSDSAAHGAAHVWSDPRSYGVILALTAAGLLSKYAATAISTRTESKSMEDFRKEFNEKQQGHPYSEFVDALAEKLQRIDHPRFVIIDHYERLDYTTQSVVNRYFEKYSERATAPDCWIIFENENRERFSNRVIERPKLYGYKQTRCLQQLALRHDEKQQLVQMLQLDKRNVEFTSVKWVCGEGQRPAAEWISNFFEEHRKHNPKNEVRYGNLELFYLLSLATSPPNISFPITSLTSDLSAKTPLRAKVISQFLYGTRLTKDEFRVALPDIEKEFARVLAESDAGEIRLEYEAALVLEAEAAQLELPDAKLGHLFWSLYWYDKLQNQPPQVLWLRKLAHHLLRSDASKVQDGEVYKGVIEQIFEACIYSIDACLKVCFFRDVPSLLEKAVAIQTDQLSENASHRKRALKRCWEAYSVLGDERMLSLIWELQGASGESSRTPVQPQEDLLEAFFLESISLSPAGRSRLPGALLGPAIGTTERIDSASYYAKVCSAWLALTTTPMLGELAATDLFRAAVEADGCLQNIAEKTVSRLSGSSGELPRVTDILGLSLSLWCNALRVREEVWRTLGPVEELTISAPTGPVPQDSPVNNGQGLDPEVAHDPLLSPLERATKAGAHSRFLELIGLAESAMLLAAEIKRGAVGDPDADLSVDLLMNGLSRELCVSALVSLVTGYSLRFDRGRSPLDENVLKRIGEIIEYGNTVLDGSLPLVKTEAELASQELMKEIDRGMHLCSYVWTRFGLDRLRDYVNMRRVHFISLCLGRTPDTSPTLGALATPMSNQQGFTGIIGNCIIASCLGAAGELSAYYVRQGALLALRGNFGDRVKRELSFIALVQSHAYECDLTPFVSILLDGEGQADRYLFHFLSRTPEDQWCAHVLRLLNATRQVNRPELAVRFRETIAPLVGQLKSESVRREISSLLEVSSLDQRIRQKEALDSSVVLETWTSKKDLWTYPWVLDLMLSNGNFVDQVCQESISLLNHDPFTDNYTTYFRLALAVLTRPNHSGDGRCDKMALAYVQRGILQWSVRLSLDENVRTYRALHYYDHDPINRQRYIKEIGVWLERKVYRDHQQRVPELARLGRFFLLFEDYFDSMAFWGLRTELNDSALDAHLAIQPEQRRKLAEAWKSDGGAVPEPIIRNAGLRFISSRFFYLGDYLLKPPNDDDPRFNDDRLQFDKKAAEALPELLEMIASLPRLPQSVRAVLDTHSKALLEHLPLAAWSPGVSAAP